MTITTITRHRCITTKLLLLLLLLTTGTGEVWGETVTKYSRSGVGEGDTEWKESDLTAWTANTAGSTFEIDGGLKTGGGNASYEYQKALEIDPAGKLTITGTWNTGSSLGRAAAYNYLQFGTVELRAYGQGLRGTIVINGEETELTTSSGDVRGDADWTFSITITQATGDVSYTITPPSGAKSGTGNAGVLDFSAIKMGYLKTGSLDNTHQTLKAISITQELYHYTVRATGSLNQQIASGDDGPSASLTIPYHHYIKDGTTLHVAARQGSDPHYGVAFTLDADNKEVNITYASHATNVAVFKEAEDFLTPVTNNNYVYIRCSGTGGGYASTAQTVATLPSGAYTITAASYGRPTDFVFSSGGSDKWTHSFSAWGESTSENVQLAEGDLQVRGGSNSYPLDYVYVTRAFAYDLTSTTYNIGTSSYTSTAPTLTNTSGAIVTYSSSIREVADVDPSTGAITFNHNGTTYITAKATISGTEYWTYYRLDITGETNATATWTPDPPTTTETYTLSGTGYIDQTAEGTLITMSYGSASETQTVSDGKAHCIDANGYWHAHLSGGATGIPDMGTYYVFTPNGNGTLTINALVSEDGGKGRNGLRLVDGDGNILERFTSIGTVYQDYAFNTLLIAGRTYYVFAETGAMETKLDDDAYSTLLLHSFTFTQMEGTTISLIDQSLLFTTETNSNRKQLDRTIPRFTLEFGGGDGAKYTGGGIFVLRNASATNNDESQNGKITITPRFASGSTFAITGVTLNIGSKAENKEDDPATKPIISVNGVEKSVSANSNISWSSSDLSSADNSKLEIQLKGSTKFSTKNKIQVYLNSITFNYSTTSTTLDDSKGTIDLRSAASSTYIYGYEGDDVENDTYFFQPHAFSGDVTFEYEGDGFAEATTTVKKLLDTDNVAGLSGSDAEVKGLIHFGENDIDSNDDGKLDSYDKYKVHIGSGAGKLTASFAATDYFAASTAMTRLYSRDYEESPAKVLAAGDSYTWPAGNGMTFEITTVGDGTITLNGGDNITMTAGTPYVYTVASAENKVVVKNAGESAITISKVKTYRKSAELEFSYQGAVGGGSDVLFLGSSYTPNTFSITSEAEAGIASKYETTGTYAITQAVTGVSINESSESSGVITVDDGAANGVLKVTLTVNPLEAYKATYAPLTEELELKVVDGVWDFRSYSRDEHYTMYNSDGWYGQEGGWYAGRDNAEFADILREDGTPLPRALALQTMGKHRLLHTDHGYLHLQGKGIGGNESAYGGGQLRIPAKAGMLVELNCYSDDILSEMEIDGVTDLEGNVVTMFYANNNDTKSQYFLARVDGYIVVRNPSTNLDLHIRYINVSAEMAFKYGEEDENGDIVTYVDAQAGKWTNPVMNQGTTTITYGKENNINEPVSEINSSTGEVTLSSAYGKFTVTATGSGTGLLAGKTGSYIAYSVGVTATGLSRTISDSHVFELKDRIGIDVGNITETEASVTEANLKDKVVFSLVDNSPSVTLSGSTLTIEGVQSVRVKATLGSIEKTFTCTLNGGTLTGGLNPVIANDATSYTITLSGGNNHKFKLKEMYDGIVGDLKTSNTSLVFKNVDDAKNPVRLDVTDTEVSCSNLLVEGFSTIKKGGVIPIYASYTYGDGETPPTYDIEGTLTVAYTSHVWRFQHNLLTGMDSDGENAEETADKLADDALAGYGSAHGLRGGLGGWKTAENSKTDTWDVDYATIDQPTDNGTRSDNYNWKFVRKIENHTETPIIYYYNHAVEGQNALVIPETEGLHLFSSPSNKQLGVSMSSDTAPYDCRNLMLLRGGKLTIPKLKKGQWVEVRWTRHKEEMGERILMTNLSDVDGTAITSTYKIGNCFYNLPASTSTYMFQATEDGDVTFEVADNIYVSIQEIILHEPGSGWTFKSSISSTLKGYDDATTPSSDWTGDTAPDVDWVYLWNDDASHTLTFLTKDFQNAPNAPQKWTFEIDDMLKREGAVMTTTGVDNGEATLTYNGGWGKATVTMTCYSQNMKYVANKKSWTLTFGLAPKQKYPYTWDFTKFFSNTLGSTTNDITWGAVGYTADNNTLRVATYNNYSGTDYSTKGHENSYNTDDYDSYYVEGGQLVSYNLRNTNNGVLRETAGLGFKMDTSDDSDGKPDQNMLLLNMTNNIASAQQAVNGQTWATVTEDGHQTESHMTIGSGGTVIVPKPNDAVNYGNYYIYIKSSHKPTTATNVTDCSDNAEVPTPEDTYNKVYKYQFSANADAEFTFTSSDDATTDTQLHDYVSSANRKYTDIYAIAVTKDYKTVKRLNDVGWATESRDYVVDYTLDSLLTNRPLQAYSVIARSSNPIYSTDKAKTTVRLQDRNYVVPASQGLVLKQVTDSPGANGGTYTVPLFVPAVTTATEPDYTFTNNLMRPNLTETVLDSETEKISGTTYTRFILSEKYMTWRKEGDSSVAYDEKFTSGAVPGFYRLHIYADTDYDVGHLTGTNRNILGANKAYLVLPSEKINSPIWQTSTPARESYFIGIEGVSDVEDITEVTEAPVNNATYNINGQRVADGSTLSPGIYIRNGKKYLVK